jgi:1,4-dihydroxy-2-naphthoyl-CoA hydrolase
MAIWFGNPTPELINQQQAGSCAPSLGFVMTEIGADFVRGTLPVLAHTRQPYGILHGGASVLLAETLGSIAATLVIDPETKICLGQEINANHLRAVREGLVTGTARPYHLGGRSQVWGIEIRDAAGRLSCVSRLTIAVVDRPQRTGAQSP